MKDKRRRRGLDFQRWIVKWLEERDWICENFIPISIKKVIRGKEMWVSKRSDPFGCIDIVGKKKYHRTLWIQATLHTGKKVKADKLMKVPWAEYADDVQIWIKRSTGSIDIYQLDEGEFIQLGKILQRKFYKSEGKLKKEKSNEKRNDTKT